MSENGQQWRPGLPKMAAMPAFAPDAAYAAVLARDARFDGRLFVGVTSTGIYCRPICRVRTPRRENCRFFESAAQAEAEAFRPCMKCRPELAPPDPSLAWTTMDASRTLARQAAAWLEACDDAEASIEQLAEHLGITSRHLRRIFLAEHGVTPLQYLQTRRLLLAKALLTDTALPVRDVAASAGFASLRRFNAAFVQHYRLQPSRLRAQRGAPAPGSEPSLRLAYRPPLAVEALLKFLAARAVPEVEQVDVAGRRIERSLALDVHGVRHAGGLAVRFDETASEVLLSLDASLWPAVGRVVALVRRWLDLDADPGPIAAHLQPLLPSSLPGLRLPGCLDRFELAVRAVLGQQITVAAARTLAGRLVGRLGEALPDGRRLFPQPVAVAAASRDEIAALGITGRRAETLRALAEAWPRLRYAQQSLAREGSVAEALAELCELPGIGPWTAHYMLMRGWSWPDAFPPGDVVLRKQLDITERGAAATRAEAAAAARFSPFGSYAVLELWRTAP